MHYSLGFLFFPFIDSTNVEELRHKFNYKYRRIADRAGEYLRKSNRDVWMCDAEVYMKSIMMLIMILYTHKIFFFFIKQN